VTNKIATLIRADLFSKKNIGTIDQRQDLINQINNNFLTAILVVPVLVGSSYAPSAKSDSRIFRAVRSF
jgi:hypothetical protein